MRRWLALTLALASGAMLCLASGSGPFNLPIVHAAQTWNVVAGGDGDQIPGGGSLTSIGFFPSAVTINAGDTVSWTFPSAEPHGVAFEAGQQVPFAFQINPGPTPGDLDITNIFLPINLDKINGAYKPGIPFASGVPQDPPDQRKPFTLTFDTPGVYSYDCQIHGPVMGGTIVVLASGASPSETPAQTQARGQGERAAALGGGSAALQGPTAPNGGAPLAISGGSTVYPVTAGVEPGANAAALAFFPNNLTVHQGDTVVFTQTDPQEIHTVTLLSGGAPPEFVTALPENGPPQQLIVPANVAGPAGGNSYDGASYLNSGILFPGQSYSITFNAPPGTYTYVCLIHGGAPQNMTATITVVQ